MMHELLLLLSMAMMGGPLAVLQTMQCCCSPPPVCSRAICSNGGPIGSPTQYQIDISGMSASGCGTGDCSSLDGSRSVTIPSGCGAAATFTSTTHAWDDDNNIGRGPGCSAGTPTTSQVGLGFFTGVGLGSIRVTIETKGHATCYPSRGCGFFSPPHTIEQTYRFEYTTPAVDCSALSSLALSWANSTWLIRTLGGSVVSTGSGAACTGSGATCEVSTV